MHNFVYNIEGMVVLVLGALVHVLVALGLEEYSALGWSDLAVLAVMKPMVMGIYIV